MSYVFAALNSKGGVGKTTLLANVGGLLADMGARVLLVDADPQPSLTNYYALTYEAPEGLAEAITQGVIDSAMVSRTSISNLDLVRSNDPTAQLQFWLHERPDARTRLSRALRNDYVESHYDYVLIDTQGAIGTLQMAAAFAADRLISPLPPDTPSVREFCSNTLRVLKRLANDETHPRAELAPIQGVICRQDRSRDARNIVAQLQSEFTADDRVTILRQTVPYAVAYKDAFTARQPVHKTNPHSRGRGTKSGYEVMHRLVWELVPATYGCFAGRLRADPDEVFGPDDSTADLGDDNERSTA